jgi:AraC-like DNA-binding protein
MFDDAKGIPMTVVNALIFSQEHSELLRARAIARNFDAHLHSTYSVVVLKKGSASVRSARWSRVVNAGDIFFFNPYEVHAAVSTDESVEYETLYPSKDFFRSSIRVDDSQLISIETDVLSGSPEARDLIDFLSSGETGGVSIMEKLERVLQLCTFAVDSTSLPSMAIARRACQIIRNDCTRAIRTEDLAREIGVHKSHFIRAFTMTTGIAPQTYIRQVRIAQARELICAGYGLSEVAQMLAFCDQAHFTREFKKVFGVPPGTMSRDIGPKRTTQCR